MIKYPDLHTVFYQVKDCTIGKYGLICPKCKDHVQNDEEHSDRTDCKTIIYEDDLKDGKLVVHSQCMCYSDSNI